MASKGGGKIGGGGLYLTAKEFSQIAAQSQPTGPQETLPGILTPIGRDALQQLPEATQDKILKQFYRNQGIFIDSKEANAHITGKEFKESLGLNEKLGIETYTGSGYGGINKALYLRKETGAALGSWEQSSVRNLDAALAKLPGYKGEVARNIHVSGEKFQTFINAYKRGKTMTFPAYTSTTVEKGGTFPGNVSFKIYSKGKAGKAIFGLSQHTIEREVLFARNAKFRVGKVTTQGTSAEIVLYEK